jgi:hypothetical protein
MDQPKIYLALPTYDGQRFNAFQITHALPHIKWANELQSSALPFCFNRLWCEMLNMRDQGKVTHFMMMHADVRPLKANFVKVLYDELVAYEADVMATILPIKNELGLTSTGIETDDPYGPRRLTMQQAYAMDETWTSDALVFNTGLWIADVRGDWAEKVAFKFQDGIRKGPAGWEAWFIPEDWDFSRQVRALGLTAYVTRKVLADHIGTHEYTNAKPWGTALSDPQHPAE